MLIHKTPSFSIYFGNAQDALYPDAYVSLRDSPESLLSRAPFDRMKKIVGAHKLIFLKQVHAADGLIITDNDGALRSFDREGDYLITSLKHVALGIMTADCLPVVCYDRVHHIVGIAHAGWRGSTAAVAPVMVQRMQKEFGTDLNEVQIFFGPSIKACCYQVGEQVQKQLSSSSFADEVIQWHGGDMFFDLPGLNRLQLEELGVNKEAFHLDYNVCTVCDEHFFSFRRQGESAGRQMTVACLG